MLAATTRSGEQGHRQLVSNDAGGMQLAATIAVVASVLVLALQTRELTKQSRVANQVAATYAHRELSQLFAAVYAVFIQYPDLRAHFYGKATSAPTETESVRLHLIADQYADALEVVLDTTDKLAAYGWVSDEWNNYARYLIANSPILRSTIRDHPNWWAPLAELVAEHDSTQPGSQAV
jgi:hypothetical protein